MNVFQRPVTRPLVRLLWILVPAVLIAGASACNRVTDPSKNLTETWTGTLPPGGTVTFNFNSGNNGEYAITLKSLTPDSNLPVALGFGLQGGGCNLVNYTTTGVGFGLAGAINQGPYCAVIWDAAGVLPQNETFTVTVAHP